VESTAEHEAAWPMKVLVTGSAGFIGFHTATKLITRGDAVVGIDNVNDYYDPALKEARLAELDRIAEANSAEYTFIRGDLSDQATVDKCFRLWRQPQDAVLVARRCRPSPPVLRGDQAGK
jgi:nucleoside-diphosphate-sugar epimerase